MTVPRGRPPERPGERPRESTVGPVVVAVLAGLAHLVVGWFYLAGGLIIPGAVLIPLWIVWILLAALLVYLAVRRSWWTLAVPIAAAVIFVVVLVFGGQVLGWTA